MASRETLHRLVDELPEGELARAERVLDALRETAYRPSYTLEDAPEDDEPESPEEAAAVAEAWREHREGRTLTTEQVRRELDIE